jgi:hypothetical protein
MELMKYKLVNGEVREKYKLHEFTMGDVEDVEVYMAQPIYEWQQTPAGKFCMENATEITHHTWLDLPTYTTRVVITGYLSGKQATFWALKKS